MGEGLVLEMQMTASEVVDLLLAAKTPYEV